MEDESEECAFIAGEELTGIFTKGLKIFSIGLHLDCFMSFIYLVILFTKIHTLIEKFCPIVDDSPKNSKNKTVLNRRFLRKLL